MSSYSNEGDRGAKFTITPSARKPIHTVRSPCNDFAYRDNMTTRTFNKSKDQSFPTFEDEGADEVDNILSKPVRPTSPLSTRKLPSGSAVDEESSDSDNESINDDILSSSPRGTPLSFSRETYKNYNKSPYCQSSHAGANNLSGQYSHENRRDSASYPHNEKQQEGNKSTHYTKIIITTLVVGVIAVCMFNTEKTINTDQINYDRFKFYSDVKTLGRQYKVTDDTLLQVQTGINTIFEKQDTASFIFTYDSDNDNFDALQFNNFMDNIASAASRYLRNDTKDVRHVVLDSNKMISLKSDYDLIEKFKHNVDQTGVLLVKDIDKVPSKFAMAFHYYCDEYNPLVKKSAIFFTLNVAECSMSSNKKATHDFIEKCLKHKWKDVQSDKIGPLLNRVVNIVIDVMTA